jgi:hypothetical protein
MVRFIVRNDAWLLLIITLEIRGARPGLEVVR